MASTDPASTKAARLRVGILGCGALGGVMAARLAEEPTVELEVYNTNPEIAAAVQGQGLVLVEGRRKTVHRVSLQPPSRAGAPLDLLILAAKAVGLVEAARGLLPSLTADGLFVTTQNGLVALDLIEALGPERVVAGAVLWGASMDAPGVYRITSSGPFVIGGTRVEAAARVLARIFPVVQSDNMPGVLWAKLAITASFTTLGAITALRFGELARSRRTRRVLLGLGAEVLAVARARGIRLEPLGSGLNVERFLSETGYPPVLKTLLMRAVGFKHRRTESSMLDSLRRGRRTELEFLNARVVHMAEEAGVACPLNRAAAELVREIEAGRIRSGVEHLSRFAVG